MPKFNIPRIVRPLDLAKYAPELQAELAGQDSAIFMWLNLSRRMDHAWVACQIEGKLAQEKIVMAITEAQPKEVLDALRSESDEALRHIAAWWSEAWSQGPPETHWTVEAVQELMGRCSNEDPALWEFIANECWNLIVQHRERARKN